MKTLQSSGDPKDGILSWNMYEERIEHDFVLVIDIKGERQLSESGRFFIGRNFPLYGTFHLPFEEVGTRRLMRSQILQVSRAYFSLRERSRLGS